MAQTTPHDALLDEQTVTDEPLTVIDEPRLDATPADDEVSDVEDDDDDDDDDDEDEDDEEDDEDAVVDEKAE